MKKKYSSVLWAGSDEAFEIFAGAPAEAAKIDASRHAEISSEEDKGLLTIVNGVGVIRISGVLTNKDAWYNSYLGLVSYGAIQEALYKAVADPKVHELLLDIDSPGGTVNGLTDTIDAVAKAASAKPMTAFTDSVMASGAMGLATPAQKRYAGPMAMVGSIGVIAKHVEVSKMMAEAGITETMIRGGEFKQLANSSEPLTEKSRATIQSIVDHAYGVFVQSAADNLGKSYQLVDTRMAQGREFMGSQAVDVGLIDAVSTFDDVFAEMQTRISKKSKSTGGDMKKRYAMSEAMKLAAAASGAQIEGAADEALANIAALGTEGADSTQTEEEIAAAAPAVAEAAEPEEAEEPNALTAMDLLKAQLEEKDEKIFALKTDLVKATAEADAIAKLKEIGAQAINNMMVALGGTALDLAAASASDIVAQHTATAERFCSEFKIGGVAATASDDSNTAPVTKKAPISRMDGARLSLVAK